MSFEPSLELPQKRKKAFDPTLCIVCQTPVNNTSNRGRPAKKDALRFQVFIDVCQAFREKDDNTYDNIYQAIKAKTPEELDSEGFCYHSLPCRNDFQRIYANIIRRREITPPPKTNPLESLVLAIERPSREDTASFDKNSCLFCQEDSQEVLFNVVQDSRDQKLKDAFHECPTSLSLYKIRTEHAFDAMAGDIKYHHSCWRDKIDHRVREVKISKPLYSSSEHILHDDSQPETMLDFMVEGCNETWENFTTVANSTISNEDSVLFYSPEPFCPSVQSTKLDMSHDSGYEWFRYCIEGSDNF